MTDPGKDADHIALLRQFEESSNASSTEREMAERDRDYYDGKQLTPEEEQTLKLRKQPIVISNRIRPKIDSLLGFERKQRTDPKAYPRTPKHEQDANSATDALRFVCDQNRFQNIRSEVAESMFVEGIGAATVTMRKRPDGELDVALTVVPWDRFYRDPHSRRRDFSDAAYLGVVLWMDEADVLAEFKDAKDVIEGCYDSHDAEGETYDDRPRVSWGDKKRKRVRVLQHRWREKGVWNTAILTKGGFLRPPQPSPYKDEFGQPECDLIAVSCYVDRENRRYGMARNMISAQDEINKRRSKLLHRLSVRQVVAEHGAVQDVAAAKAELAKPDGYIEKAPGMEFEIVSNDGAAAGEMELLREAKAEIDSSGVNPALQGDLQAPSGRAVEALTAAGLAETAIAFDALRDFSLRVYKQIWNRVRQYWTEERWVRVTDDERNMRWVGINRPVTPEVLQERGQPVPPGAMPGQVLGVENRVSDVEVDIILEEGPDTVTIQSEQFEQLVELKRADPASIPTSAIIEASSLLNKDKILEHIESNGVPPELQKQMQEMQQALQECQQQLQQAQQAAGMEKQEAQAIKSQVSSEIKVARAEMAQREAEMRLEQMQFRMDQLMQGQEQQIAAYEAQTNRIAALKPEPSPTFKED
jgi:hypothetical protein